MESGMSAWVIALVDAEDILVGNCESRWRDGLNSSCLFSRLSAPSTHQALWFIYCFRELKDYGDGCIPGYGLKAMEGSIWALEIHWSSRLPYKGMEFLSRESRSFGVFRAVRSCVVIDISLSRVPDATPVCDKPRTLSIVLRQKGEPC